LIYAVSRPHYQRFLEGRTVFCKYVGRRNPEVDGSVKLVFYLSGGSKNLVGEGTIESTDLVFSIGELLLRYGGRLFLDEVELRDYQERRPRPVGSRLLVIVLKDVREYRTPIALGKPLTMAGLKLDKRSYERLVGGAGEREYPLQLK